MFGRISSLNHRVQGFSFLGDFWLLIQSSYQLCLFRFSNSSYLNLVDFVFLEMYHLMQVIQFVGVQLFIIPSYNPFYFSRIVSKVCIFISDFNSLCLLTFFHPSSKRFVNCVNFFKKTTSGFTDFLYCVSIVCFIYFCSNLYYILLSASFVFSLLFFS